VVERESERREEGEEEDKGEEEGNERKEEEKDVEKGQVLGVKEKVIDNSNIGVNNDLPNRLGDSHVAMMQRLNPTNPLRIVINGSSRMPTPSPSQTSLPRSTPTPQVSFLLWKLLVYKMASALFPFSFSFCFKVMIFSWFFLRCLRF
jgi:hypothetical protein